MRIPVPTSPRGSRNFPVAPSYGRYGRWGGGGPGVTYEIHQGLRLPAAAHAASVPQLTAPTASEPRCGLQHPPGPPTARRCPHSVVPELAAPRASEPCSARPAHRGL